MLQPTIDREVLWDPSWRHWAVTIPLVGGHLAGYAWAIWPAIALCAAMGVYYFARIRQLQPYPVQIRLVYFGMLLAGLLPWMQWIHWVQLCGTTAMVTVGYCPLARILNLFPINRDEPLTWEFVGRTFFRDPCAGGVVKWGSELTAAACCALPTSDAKAACAVIPNPTKRQRRRYAEAH